MACDDRQLTEAQRVAGYQNQRTGVAQAVRPFSGRPTVENLVDYINRELYPAVKATRNKVNDIYLPVVDNAPSGNPLGYYFSTETGAADPTAGRIRLNASPQDTATVMRVSQSSGRLVDVAPWLDVMAGGATTPLGVVTLTDAINPARFIRFDLSTMVDQGAYWDLTVAVIESSHDDPFADGGAVVVSFIPGVGGVTPATVPPTSMSAIAANTVLANATASSAAPTAVSVGTNTVLGRVAGNIVAAQLVNAQITDGTIANAKLADMVASRVKGRAVGAGTGAPTDLTGLELGSIARLLSGNSGFVAAGTYNDHAITDGVHVVDIAPTGGDVIFTGFAYGSSNTGAFFWLTKFGTGGNVIIRHQNTGSASGNRVSTPGSVDFVLSSAGSGVLIAWDNTRLQVITGSTLSSTFPGAPIYDVMASPFYAAGDGTTDDTVAINAAIAAANAEAGMIYFGAAHRVTAALTPVTASCVVFQGRGRFAGGTDLTVDAAAAADWITFDGCQYSGIQDTRIRGVGALYTSGAAVKFDGTYGCHARRLNISQLGDGIDVESAVLTHIDDSGIADLYGSFGIRFHGTAGNVAHSLHVDHVVCGTDFPSSVVGFTRDWQASTAYVAGNAVTINGNIYQATVGGTSGGTGPSGIPGATVATAHTATVTDGSVTWVLAMPLVDWFLHDNYAHTFRLIDSGALQGGVGFRMIDSSAGLSPPQFARGLNCEFDHVASCGILLEGGGQAEFEQTFITSMLNGPAIEIGSSFEGDVRFNGGVLFAGGVEAIIVGAGDLIIAGLIIGGYGLFTANTYDAIRVDASVSRWSIENCQTGIVPGSASPATRYGISIAAGCDNYSVQSNRNVGHQTGGILNTPGVATTRIVRNNIPDTATGIVPDGDYGDVVVSSSGTVWQLDVAVAGDGLTGGAGTPLAVGAGDFIAVLANTVSMDWAEFLAATDSTSIVIGSNTYQRAALTGAITAAQNSNATLFDTNASGAGLTGGGTAVLAVGAGTGISVNANDVAVTIPLTDGDKGDITVASSGTVWTIDSAAVTLAKMADLAQSRIIGRAVGAGTGVPTALTGLQTGDIVRLTSGSTGFINGTFNDQAITDGVHVLDVAASGGNVVFTGFAYGSSNTGAWFWLTKFGASNTITISHQSASSAAANRVSCPDGVDYVMSRAGDAVLIAWDNTRLQVVGFANIQDGDKGDITVASSGTVWTIDSAAVTLAKMADLAQSRIIGRAEGAGTGVPTALTPTQVVAIIDGESPTWTGAHSFTGATHAVTASGDVRVETTAGGVAVGAGHAVTNPTNDDVVINAVSGIAINAHATTPVTAVATGTVAVAGTNHTVDTTANIGLTAGGTITLAASTSVLIPSPSEIAAPNLTGTLRLTGIITPSVSSSQNNWNPSGLSTANIIRATVTGSCTITGIAAQASGTVLTIINISGGGGANVLVMANEDASSTAANRIVHLFDAPNIVGGANWTLWYDGSSSRWRVISIVGQINP